MPEQKHPPYVQNAQTIPRLLNRWLDINAQNGPLTRTRKYLILPAFTINTNWRGYSTIIGEYLFSSSSAFCLRLDLNALPIYPNYTLCISHIVGGEVIRYRVFAGLYEDILFDVPNYTGENISKNFKLEIWSNQTTTCIQQTDVTIYTSVLGDVDYRYGVDTLLVSNNGLCTGQDANAVAGTFPLPLQFGACTYNYGQQNGVVLLGNQIQQVITNETGNPISI